MAAASLALVGCGGSDDGDGNDSPTDPGGGGDGGGGGGGDEIPVASGEMQGTWDYEIVYRDCDSGDVLDDLYETGTDVICAGDVVFEDDEFLGLCDVTVLSDTSYRLECSSTETIADCTVAFDWTVTVTYTATTVTATGRSSISYSGDGCQGAPDDCFEFTTTSTRTGDVPAGACDGKSFRAALGDWLPGKLPIRR
jgi:hypothetical protein